MVQINAEVVKETENKMNWLLKGGASDIVFFICRRFDSRLTLFVAGFVLNCLLMKQHLQVKLSRWKNTGIGDTCFKVIHYLDSLYVVSGRELPWLFRNRN